MVAVLSALLLFPSLRQSGLAGYDDAFFSHESKEMIHTGDWGNVRLNGEVILQIPPLFLWMQACSFKLFGINDSAAKLPSVLLGFATILLMYFFVLELTGDAWLSVLAMLVLASTQFFLKNATHAMTDVPFTFFFTLAMFFYIKGLKNALYLVLFGLPFGCGLLTRSIVGLLVLGVVILHLLLTRRHRFLFSPWLISGVVTGFAIMSVWYVWQSFQHGSMFLLTHLQFLNSKIHAEGQHSYWATIFAYPLSLLKYYWPWLPFLIVGFVMEFRAAKNQRDSTATLLLLWVFIVLVPFTLAETRYPRYIMCAFPAFSILSAIALNRVIPISRRQIFFNVACLVLFLVVCGTFLFPPKPRAVDMRKIAPIAEANSSPGERVLFYTYEDGREDFLYQFLWYSNRYGQRAANLNDLAEILQARNHATAIVDKNTYQKLLPLIASKTPQVLGESGNLICFRLP